MSRLFVTSISNQPTDIDVTNNIGRLIRNFIGEHNFDPDLVLGHEAIWAIKSDPGPEFLISFIRNAVCSNTEVTQYPLLLAYPMAPDEDRSLDYLWQNIKPDYRDANFVHSYVFEDHDVMQDATDDELEEVQNNLFTVGFNCGVEENNIKKLTKFIKWYQYSTRAYAKIGHPDRVLTVDGIAGPKTRASLKKRLSELAHKSEKLKEYVG